MRLGISNEQSNEFNWIILCKDNVELAFVIAEVSLFGSDETRNKAKRFHDDLITQLLSAIYMHIANLEKPTPVNAYKLVCETDALELVEMLSKSSNQSIAKIANLVKKMSDKVIYGYLSIIKDRLKFIDI
jgi:hypothetical protein